jgi:hypothetical protein
LTDFGKRVIGGTIVPTPFLCKIQNRF